MGAENDLIVIMVTVENTRLLVIEIIITFNFRPSGRFPCFFVPDCIVEFIFYNLFLQFLFSTPENLFFYYYYSIKKNITYLFKGILP